MTTIAPYTQLSLFGVTKGNCFNKTIKRTSTKGNEYHLVELPIPLPVYLEKFLNYTYGKQLICSFNSVLGGAILLSLNKKPEDHAPLKCVRSFPVLIPKQYIKRDVVIDERRISFITFLIDNMFRDYLTNLAFFNKKVYDKNYTDTIRGYLSLLQIDEDEFAFRSLERDVQRRLVNLKSR